MADELKGPSVFEIRQFIQDKILIEFLTINNKLLRGQIVWFDGESYHLVLESGEEITLLRTAIVYYSKQK